MIERRRPRYTRDKAREETLREIDNDEEVHARQSERAMDRERTRAYILLYFYQCATPVNIAGTRLTNVPSRTKCGRIYRQASSNTQFTPACLALLAISASVAVSLTLSIMGNACIRVDLDPTNENRLYSYSLRHAGRRHRYGHMHSDGMLLSNRAHRSI